MLDYLFFLSMQLLTMSAKKSGRVSCSLSLVKNFGCGGKPVQKRSFRIL